MPSRALAVFAVLAAAAVVVSAQQPNPCAVCAGGRSAAALRRTLQPPPQTDGPTATHPTTTAAGVLRPRYPAHPPSGSWSPPGAAGATAWRLLPTRQGAAAAAAPRLLPHPHNKPVDPLPLQSPGQWEGRQERFDQNATHLMRAIAFYSYDAVNERKAHVEEVQITVVRAGVR